MYVLNNVRSCESTQCKLVLKQSLRKYLYVSNAYNYKTKNRSRPYDSSPQHACNGLASSFAL